MGKKKIAFYHPNAHFSTVDCTQLEKGNPGIGGSEYVMLCVADKLAKNSDKLDVCLITQSDNDLMPTGGGKLVKYRAVTESELLKVVHTQGIDVLVFRHFTIKPDSEFFTNIGDRCKIVIWCQNFVRRSYLNLYDKYGCVAKIVAVGKEQLEQYVDHHAYKKSDYIYNCIPQELIDEARANMTPLDKRGKVVVYMGSLTWEKSFHVLAKSWPEVANKVPGAELYIIGSGNLYDRTRKLGKYQIADEAYEACFMPYLTDAHGNILPSVHFMGRMGAEKNDILRKARVGVPNPTGYSETFCVVGVEMQLAGCLLTAAKYSAYLDTFNPKFSILSNGPSSLADNIVRLLMKEDMPDMSEEIDFIEEKFSLNKIYKEWERLLSLTMWKNERLHDDPYRNLMFKWKWLKLVNKAVKDVLPGGYRLLPSMLLFNRWLKTYSA